MKFFKKSKDNSISSVVILAALFGFAAGLVGQLVADTYLDPWQEWLVTMASPTGADPVATPELQRVKRVVGTQQDFAVADAIERTSGAVALIYQSQRASAEPLQQIYQADEALGSGFMLTSDGWLATHQSVVAGVASSQLRVLYGQQLYPVIAQVVDAMTDVVFLKIAAANAVVVTLGDATENYSGQLVIPIDGSGAVSVTTIKEATYRPGASADDYVFSTEQYPNRVLLDSSLPTIFGGAPVVNVAREVIGLVAQPAAVGGATVVGVDQFRPILVSVLRDNLIKRPWLGVTYLDLAHTPGLEQAVTRGQTQGALILRTPANASPAAAAGVRSGDIIVAVDNQAVDRTNSLTDLIQHYQPGDELTLDILRNQGRLPLTVRLGLQPE